MTCQPYADAVVDPAAARPTDLEAHLKGCADCRALRGSVRAAVLLQGVRLPEVPSPRPSRVLPRAAVGLGGVVALALVGWASLPVEAVPGPGPEVTQPEPARVPVRVKVTTAEPRVEGFTEVGRPPQAHPERQLFALAELSAQVGGYTRVDATARAELAAFRGLPTWFALPRSPGASFPAVIATPKESP